MAYGIPGMLERPASYTKKFSDEGVMDISGNKSDAPWPVFRLAEMYLNKAEAAMELGKTAMRYRIDMDS